MLSSYLGYEEFFFVSERSVAWMDFVCLGIQNIKPLQTQETYVSCFRSSFCPFALPKVSKVGHQQKVLFVLNKWQLHICVVKIT
jgi:hypothetical protein